MCKRKFDMLERPTEITEVKSQNWAESIQCNSMHFFLNVMFAAFLVSWFRCESGGKEEKHSFCGVALRPALDYIKSPQIWLPVIIRFLFMFMIYKMIGQCVSENLFSNTSWPTCGDGSKTLALTADEKKMGPYKMVSWLWVEHWEPLVVWWCLMHFVRVGSIKDKAMVSRLIILQMLVLLAIKACDYLSEFSSPGVMDTTFCQCYHILTSSEDTRWFKPSMGQYGFCVEKALRSAQQKLGDSEK